MSNREKFGERNMTSQTQWAWAAGIVDGEGTLTVCIQKRLSGIRSALPRLQVVNTNEVIIRTIETIFQSTGVQPSVRCNLHPSKNPKAKPIWILYVQSRSAIIQLLTKLIPFLVGKREQASILMHICAWQYQGGDHRYPDWMWAEIDRIRKLNHVGIPTPSQTGSNPVGEETRTSARCTS